MRDVASNWRQAAVLNNGSVETEKIKVSAEFRSSDVLGLPSTADRDKYMGFMKLLREMKLRTGVITNPIRFSGYSLLRVLGQCDSGQRTMRR